MEESEASRKRQRTDQETRDQQQQTPEDMQLVLAAPDQPAGSSAAHAAKVHELVTHPLERLKLSINPSYLTALKSSNELGYERPIASRVLGSRYYEIKVDNFRANMTTVLEAYLKYKYVEQGRMTSSQIDAELKMVVPITVDACMTALYAKIRAINQQTGEYSNRFSTRPTYNRDIEIPLPYADAIQQLGRFATTCMKTNYTMIPTFPENVENEGRKDKHWRSYKYESIMQILKNLGIPLRSVDTRSQDGSAWWTYRLEDHGETVDFHCILPFLHYSNHSAMLSLLFATRTNTGELSAIITHKDDDLDYGCRLKEIWNGTPLRAFSGLCHAPSEEWNLLSNAK